MFPVSASLPRYLVASLSLVRASMLVVVSAGAPAFLYILLNPPATL
jgi:hypothetical protein